MSIKLDTLKSALERALGAEYYRIVKGVFTTPVSVIGLLIILGFIVMAAAAPVLAEGSGDRVP